MRTIGLAVIIMTTLCGTAYGQQRPSEHSGEGFFIWRNAEFVHDDWRRLRDGRAEQAMDAARENVLAFQRLRAATETVGAATIQPTATGRAVAPRRVKTEAFARAPARKGTRR